jgi:hypothetical protein
MATANPAGPALGAAGARQGTFAAAATPGRRIWTWVPLAVVRTQRRTKPLCAPHAEAGSLTVTNSRGDEAPADSAPSRVLVLLCLRLYRSPCYAAGAEAGQLSLSHASVRASGADFAVRDTQLARLGGGDHAELGQHRVHVEATPALFGLAVLDAADVDGLDADALAGRGHAHEVAGVGTGHGGPAGEPVTVGQQVLDGDVQVGERGPECDDLLPEGLDSPETLGMLQRTARVADVLAVADALGIGQFPVTGFSGGDRMFSRSPRSHPSG